MTEALDTEEATTAWFYRYIKESIELSEESDPAKIKEEIMEEGFTWDEALAGVEVMLTDYIRRVQASLAKRHRKGLGGITEPDDPFAVAFDPALTEKQRRAKERDRQRKLNRAKLSLESEWQKFLNSDVRGLDHKTWREMTIEDVTEYIKIRYEMVRTNKAEAQRMEIVRAYMKDNQVQAVGDLSAKIGQELFAL